MRTKNRYRHLITAIAIGTLALAACATQPAADTEVEVEGQEESGEADDHEHELTDGSFADAETITIIATEFGYEPSSIELHAGEAVNIMLVNEGIIEHELQIEALDFHLHTEAGETAMAGLIPEESGTYEFACLIAGHFEAGMFGEVEVVGEHDD